MGDQIINRLTAYFRLSLCKRALEVERPLVEINTKCNIYGKEYCTNPILRVIPYEEKPYFTHGILNTWCFAHIALEEP